MNDKYLPLSHIICSVVNNISKVENINSQSNVDYHKM